MSRRHVLALERHAVVRKPQRRVHRGVAERLPHVDAPPHHSLKLHVVLGVVAPRPERAQHPRRLLGVGGDEAGELRHLPRRRSRRGGEQDAVHVAAGRAAEELAHHGVVLQARRGALAHREVVALVHEQHHRAVRDAPRAAEAGALARARAGRARPVRLEAALAPLAHNGGVVLVHHHDAVAVALGLRLLVAGHEAVLHGGLERPDHDGRAAVRERAQLVAHRRKGVARHGGLDRADRKRVRALDQVRARLAVDAKLRKALVLTGQAGGQGPRVGVLRRNDDRAVRPGAPRVQRHPERDGRLAGAYVVRRQQAAVRRRRQRARRGRVAPRPRGRGADRAHGAGRAATARAALVEPRHLGAHLGPAQVGLPPLRDDGADVAHHALLVQHEPRGLPAALRRLHRHPLGHVVLPPLGEAAVARVKLEARGRRRAALRLGVRLGVRLRLGHRLGRRRRLLRGLQPLPQRVVALARHQPPAAGLGLAVALQQRGRRLLGVAAVECVQHVPQLARAEARRPALVAHELRRRAAHRARRGGRLRLRRHSEPVPKLRGVHRDVLFVRYGDFFCYDGGSRRGATRRDAARPRRRASRPRRSAGCPRATRTTAASWMSCPTPRPRRSSPSCP